MLSQSLRRNTWSAPGNLWTPAHWRWWRRRQRLLRRPHRTHRPQVLSTHLRCWILWADVVHLMGLRRSCGDSPHISLKPDSRPGLPCPLVLDNALSKRHSPHLLRAVGTQMPLLTTLVASTILSRVPGKPWLRSSKLLLPVYTGLTSIVSLLPEIGSKKLRTGTSPPRAGISKTGAGWARSSFAVFLISSHFAFWRLFVSWFLKRFFPGTLAVVPGSVFTLVILRLGMSLAVGLLGIFFTWGFLPDPEDGPPGGFSPEVASPVAGPPETAPLVSGVPEAVAIGSPDEVSTTSSTTASRRITPPVGSSLGSPVVQSTRVNPETLDRVSSSAISATTRGKLSGFVKLSWANTAFTWQNDLWSHETSSSSSKANKIKRSPHKTQFLFDKHEIGFE